MSLSELMSSMDLAFYPQVALVIFLLVFAAVTWRVFTRRSREESHACAMIPLDDGLPRRADDPAARR